MRVMGLRIAHSYILWSFTKKLSKIWPLWKISAKSEITNDFQTVDVRHKVATDKPTKVDANYFWSAMPLIGRDALPQLLNQSENAGNSAVVDESGETCFEYK